MSEPQSTTNRLLSRGGLAPVAWETGEALKSKGDMVFSSLHHHTTFSYMDGYGTPEQHALRAAELGMFGLALTEHGNVTSHVQHEQACDKHGVKPLYGCEFYCGGIGDEATQKKNHLTVLAEDQDGYNNLLKLVSRAWSEGHYYQPTVDGGLFKEHAKGLVVLSGCQASLLATSLVGGKNIEEGDASYARGKAVAKRFRRLLGDAYYLEVQAFPELQTSCDINQLVARISQELGIPLVATMDAHYTKPDEEQMQNILHSIRSGAKKSAEEIAQQWSRGVTLCPLTDADILERLVRTGLSRKQAQQAVRNSREIAERCTVRLPKVTNLRYPLPPGIPDSVTLFRRWLNEGWKYRGFSRLDPALRADYIARMKYEMELIEEKGFVDYFLIIADAVKFAKDYRGPEAPMGIPVGPARGSAAASLVCYTLRITEVNPMLFPILVFERFIDRNRFDFPDIDLDFDDELRYLVRKYLVDKYGADRVGNIATFIKYKGKNSLNDVQTAVYRGNWECKSDVDEAKSLLIERKSGDLRPSATIEDTIEMFPTVAEIFNKWPELIKATRLEGNTRGMSVHAAGLVVANEPLSKFCAIYIKVDKDGNVKLDDNGDPMEVISLDKYDVEYLNALKIDALGLKTMAMIRICLEQIGITLQELYDTPLDDVETLQGFRDQDITGVFQYDGRAARQVNAGVRPDNFMEICDINTLLRPGPLHSGATGEYIDVKHGRKEATHFHPLVDDITKHTQFQIIYQEQILQICREIGGFSWVEAARIRKIISKKRGEQEFNTMRAKFIAGAEDNGMDEPTADKVFSLMATAGGYVFNAAHCVSYGLLAYWTMWLKRNYPREFFVASLRKYEDKIVPLLRDSLRHDIPYTSVSISSEKTWSVDAFDGSIQAGWLQVPGIGPKTAANITDFLDEADGSVGIDDLGQVRGIGPKTVAGLKDFAALEDPFGIHHLKNKLDRIRELLAGGVEVLDEDGRFRQPGQTYMVPRPTHKSEEIPYDKSDNNFECTWVGVIKYRNLKELFEVHHSKTGEHLDPDTVKRPDLNEWVTMEGEDETGNVHISVSRFVYEQWKEEVWSIDLENDAVLVKGVKWKGIARRMISVNYMWVLED